MREVLYSLFYYVITKSKIFKGNIDSLPTAVNMRKMLVFN